MPSSPSPTCEVKDGAGAYGATTSGVDVTSGNTITIRLASTAGVQSWSISCITTDELSTAATVTSSLTIDGSAKTATFTAPAAGRAYRFQSQINGGIDANHVAQSSYTTTFCIYTLTTGGFRVHAVDESFEGDATFGWTSAINQLVRTIASGGSELAIVTYSGGVMRRYSPIGVSEAADNAKMATALAAMGSSGVVFVPENCLYDVTAVTIPDDVAVYDYENGRIILSKVGIEQSDQASGGHLLIRPITNNSAARFHVEPRGYPTGTTAKIDVMGDPYESDGVNYRIGNFYFISDDDAAAGMVGQNGIFVIGAKGTGNNFGINPTINFGFNDNHSNGVPMKLVYFQTTDSQWRTPYRGAWRAARSITSGDYASASFKLYQAASTGTTGATVPSHGAGTVSDGGVDWTFIRDYTGGAGFLPCVLFGARDDMPKFGLSSTYVQFAKTASIWNNVPIQFLDNTAAVAWKLSSPNLTSEFKIESADGARYLRFGSSFMQNIGQSWLESSRSISDNSATPTVTATERVTFANGSATSITSMTGSALQRIKFQGGNNNTTLVHGSNIKLVNGASRTLISGESIVTGSFDSGGTVFTEDGFRPSLTLTSGATPSVAGYAQLTFNYGSSETVTAITGNPGQTVRLRSTNGNVTLQNGTNLLLNTGANKVLTADSNLTGIINAAGTGFIEDGTL